MLSPLDLIVIVVYLLLSAGVGIACRGRQRTVDDYFTAAGGMRGMFSSVLVGLSIAATLFSGLSFLAYPSVIYRNGIALALGALTLPLSWLVLRYWFLGRYLAHPTNEPYGLLERRFGPRVRTTAALMFVLLRTGWMAALIYAPTVGIMAAADLPDTWFWPLVLAIGLSSTIYTTIGGIRGVIVTDAIQFVVMILGVLLTLLHVVIKLPVPLGEAIGSLSASGHLHLLDPSPSLTKPLTMWSILIGMTIANLANYMADPMCLQRYLAAGSAKESTRSFAINIIGAMAMIVLLVLTGLGLAVWYQYRPDPSLPAASDKVFPYFVATQLPSGIAGLLLAAILAATMSSMTSGINALSATLTLDLRVRLGREMTSREQLRFAKIASLAIGAASTLAAGVVQYLGAIFEASQTVLGVFLGPLLGCMVLAVLQTRVRPNMVLWGMIGGVAVGWVLVIPRFAIYPLWIAPITFAATACFALAGSWICKVGPSPRVAPQPSELVSPER